MPFTQSDLLSYRFQYGVNLGGIFVLEKWLFPSMFDNVGGDSELDAVQASIKQHGLEATQQEWKRHWQSALGNDHLQFLAAKAHCTTVRLPIGYFTLGPEFCHDTPFAGRPGQVYTEAWTSVVELCRQLDSVGIGVLIDLHAVPGGANCDSHSGTSSKSAAFWTRPAYRQLALQCYTFIAREIANSVITNCTGLELVNEASYDAKSLYEFYAEAIHTISAVHATLPIYISDGWDLGRARVWAAQHNRVSTHSNPVIVDTHCYYTFSAADRACTPMEILQRLPHELEASAASSHDVLGHGAAPVFIGEWSCVLDGQTWSRVPADQRQALVQQFGRMQLERTGTQCLGSSFWTWLMDWMPGGEWGFVAMTQANAIAAPSWMSLSHTEVQQRLEKAEQAQVQAREQAAQEHVEYWQRAASHETWNDARFSPGFDTGWKDAVAFFSGRLQFQSLSHPRNESTADQCGADRCGDVDLWLLKRFRELSPDILQSARAWEWEHGFRQGMNACERMLL